MQTVEQSSIRSVGAVYNKQSQSGCKSGDGEKKTDNPSERSNNDFLTAPIIPIAPKKVTRQMNDNRELNFVTQRNYKYLLKSATNYANILGKTLEHNPGKSTGEGISNLYYELNGLMDEYLNIETRGDKLVFCIYDYHDWSSYTFFWLPVKFIDSLQGQLKRIAISFVAEFSQSNGLTCLYDSDEMFFLLEYMNDTIYDMDEKEQEECSKLFERYTGGDIHKLLKIVDSKSYYKKLPAAINRYRPHNRWERSLIKLLKEGLQFIGSDKPSIMNYSYDPNYDEEPDWNPVQLDKIVRVVYDCNDFVMADLMDWINSELRESYEIRPITTLELSPKPDQLFTKDDYPERFCEWFNRITEFLLSK